MVRTWFRCVKSGAHCNKDLWDLMHQQNSRPLAREWHPSKTLRDALVKAIELGVCIVGHSGTDTMRRTLLDWTPSIRLTSHRRKLKSWCAPGLDVSVPFLLEVGCHVAMRRQAQCMRDLTRFVDTLFAPAVMR